MQNPQLVVPFVVRGSVWWFSEFPLPQGHPRDKYAVVLDNQPPPVSELSTRDIVVALTTSKDKYSSLPCVVEIASGTLVGLKGDSFLNLGNWHQVPLDKFCSSGCRWVGDLPDHVMQRIDQALQYTSRIPVHIMIRIRPLDPASAV